VAAAPTERVEAALGVVRARGVGWSACARGAHGHSLRPHPLSPHAAALGSGLTASLACGWRQLFAAHVPHAIQCASHLSTIDVRALLLARVGGADGARLDAIGAHSVVQRVLSRADHSSGAEDVFFSRARKRRFPCDKLAARAVRELGLVDPATRHAFDVFLGGARKKRRRQ
jgi:hypothetical protein